MDLGQDIVQVIVGQNQKPYSIHKNLLRQHSEYFARAFGPNFAEGEEGVMHLDDVSEQTFSVFQKWLYMQSSWAVISTGKNMILELYASPNESSGLDSETDPETDNTVGTLTYDDDELGSDEEEDDRSMPDATEHKEEFQKREITLDKLYERLVDLFIFADAYETSRLRNDAMSATFDVYKEGGCYPGYPCIKAAFGRLPPSSTLCQFLIKTYTHEWEGQDGVLPDDDSVPSSFLLPTLKLTAQVGNSKKARRKLQMELENACSFHEHANDEGKNKCHTQKRKNLLLVRGLMAVCVAVDSAETGANTYTSLA